MTLEESLKVITEIAERAERCARLAEATAEVERQRRAAEDARATQAAGSG